MQRSRVGSKGELFPPKAMREKLGLKPCAEVIYSVDSGRLIVEPVPTLEEVMEEETPVRITLKEFFRDRRLLSKKAES